MSDTSVPTARNARPAPNVRGARDDPGVRRLRSDRRATVPAASAALLLAVTVTLAGATGAVLLDAARPAAADAVPPVALSASASAADDRITLVHEAGPALDVRALSLRVTVAGSALARQPPVPFFAARGFRSGPTGPFNSAADSRWTAGEAASFALADTNAPSMDAGDAVAVRVYADGARVATVRIRAVGGDRG